MEVKIRLLPIQKVRSPQNSNFGAIIGVFRPNWYNIKTAILSKLPYCTDCNQTLYSDKDC